MDNNRIKDFLGRDSITVAEAMLRIDRNANGILLLTDEENRLVGCLTDGDVRRFLLAGGKMDCAASYAANRHPRSARNMDQARSLYHSKNYVIIPIIDENGIVVDLFAGDNQAFERPRSDLHIPVVINAGGKGTRLDPFTRVLPKPLIPVGELPIIEHIMKEYQSYQCTDFHIIVNYKRELMKAYFAENENNYHITWYDEEKPLGTGGGLSLLKGVFHDTFFFANCDALLTADYESMLRFHKNSKNVITMICASKKINIPYGVVKTGGDGVFESIREKPQIPILTNAGIYIVEPEVVEEMEYGVPISFPEIVVREKEMGKRVAVYPVSENDWMDMGQLPELEEMRRKMYGE